MKERPILFNKDMVLALLAGRKSQTRRIIKDKIPNGDKDFASPYGVIGDRLWVRENFLAERQPGNHRNPIFGQTIYAADLTPGFFERGTSVFAYNYLGPSIHLPKNKCRIWLEIIDVRAERLKSISHSDAKAEGVHGVEWSDHDANGDPDYRSPFIDLWKKINGRDSWHENPWVWAIEFKVLSTTGKNNIKADQEAATV